MMNQKIMLRTILLGILLIQILTVELTDAQVIALKVGRMIDPASGSNQTDVLILIKEKKILTIGRKIQLPKNAKVIDLSNHTILPGLIDCHTHLCNTFDAKEDVGNQLLLHTVFQQSF